MQIECYLKATDVLVTLYKEFKELILPRWLEHEEKKRLLQKLFGPISTNVYADPGRAHVLLKPGYFHPFDRYALEAIFGIIYGTFGKRRRLKFVEKAAFIDPGQNICSIGNPVSNRSIRAAMGYNDNLERTPKTNLPIVFKLNPKKIGKVNIFVEEEPIEIPNWSIQDRETREEFVPELDVHHYLKSDYLLITFMPNPSGAKGKIHASFGGTHSTGTAAVRNLVNNLDILREIDKERESSQHFQSLIKITKVTYTRRGWCKPVQLEHIKTIPL